MGIENCFNLKAKERSFIMNYKDLLVAAAFFFEFYHSLAHLTVLTGFRMLPRKDLVRAKQYFIIDAACAAIAYATHQADYFYFILILQQWQHIFYYSTWDKSRWNQLDLVLGTAFDMSVHMANTYFLGTMIPLVTSSITGIVACTLYYAVLYRQGAWSTPGRIPDWVAKRIKPLTEEQRQEVKWMDKLKAN